MAGIEKDVKKADCRVFRGYIISNRARKDENLERDRDEDEEGKGAAFDSQEMDAVLTGATNVPSKNIPFHKAGKLMAYLMIEGASTIVENTFFFIIFFGHYTGNHNGI